MGILILCYIICFAVECAIIILFKAWSAPGGSLIVSIFTFLAIFIFPRALFHAIVTRKSGKAYRCCQALYTEALVFLRSNGYQTGYEEAAHAWMALFCHIEDFFDIWSDNLFFPVRPGHVLMCFHELLQREFPRSFDQRRAVNYTTSAYEAVKKSAARRRSESYDLELPAEALAVAWWYRPKSEQVFASQFKKSFHLVLNQLPEIISPIRGN